MGNTELVSELVEYHSARGSFSTEPYEQAADWTEVATAAVPVDTVDEYALVAAGSASSGGGALTRLGPLPPLQMDPTTAPIMSRYRALACERYRCEVTADERCLVDVAVTLVLRFADVGIATYASLRVVGQPARTVTWAVQESDLRCGA